MINAIEKLFATISNSFRIQDFLDIMIIASLIYITLIWFKKTASRFVFAGIVLLGVIYILSRTFQLYLTSMLLQGFFAILLIAIVVIFQKISGISLNVLLHGELSEKNAQTKMRITGLI